MIVNINSIKDKYIQKVIEELAKEGQKIINNAELTAKVTNRSMNLRDAYVYGVYYNGNLVKFGFVGNQQSKSIHSGWAKNNIEADTGRNYARKAIKDYKPNIKKGFELVVINAIYYAQILEDGKQSLGGQHYKIISQSLGGLTGVQAKYGGTIKPLTYQDWK